MFVIITPLHEQVQYPLTAFDPIVSAINSTEVPQTEVCENNLNEKIKANVKNVVLIIIEIKF